MQAIVLILAALLITLPIAGRASYQKKNFAGILFCAVLAFVAWHLGGLFPLAGGPVIGILLGMLVANTAIPTFSEHTKAGIGVASKKVLQIAIVLFGFQMNLVLVFSLGGQAILLIFAAIAAALLTAFFVGNKIGVRGDDQILIGVGTAICGGSAIAATSPIIGAKEESVARAISTIFLFNVIAAFLFPAIGHLLSMTNLRFGMWAGSAINDTSSVVAASFSFSDAAGPIAMVVKLTRTLMIIPFCLVLSLRAAKQSPESGARFQFHKTFPWFVLGFFLASVLRTIGFIPVEITAFWGMMGRFLIVIAMVAIGLSCNLKELLQKGKKPILLGGCCSLVTAAVAFAMLYLLNIS